MKMARDLPDRVHDERRVAAVFVKGDAAGCGGVTLGQRGVRSTRIC